MSDNSPAGPATGPLEAVPHALATVLLGAERAEALRSRLAERGGQLALLAAHPPADADEPCTAALLSAMADEPREPQGWEAGS